MADSRTRRGAARRKCRAARAWISCRRISPKIRSTLAQPESVSARTSKRLVQLHRCDLARAQGKLASSGSLCRGRSRERRYFRRSPALSAISRGTHEATRKFCPSDFEKRKPWRASSARTSFISVSSMLTSSFCSGATGPQGTCRLAQFRRSLAKKLRVAVGVEHDEREHGDDRPDYRGNEIEYRTLFMAASLLVLQYFS